jgi:hypothetical protein
VSATISEGSGRAAHPLEAWIGSKRWTRPKGTLVRVKGIRRWQHPKTGIWYCYHRKSGTPIHAEFGSPDFFAELAAVEKSQLKTAKPGTLGLAMDAYHLTPGLAALRPKPSFV